MRTGRGWKRFGGDVLVDNVLPVGAAHQLLRGTAMPFFSSSVVHQHGDELPDTQTRVAFDGEMHRDRLAAVGKARALIGQA